MIQRALACAALGSVILTSASCGWLKGVEDPTEGWSADKLYVEARDNMNQANYETALDYYQKIEARYPFGRYAQQAQAETVYVHYKNHDMALATQTADGFLRQYPDHALAPYVMYLKAMATLDEDDGWMSYLTTQDLSQRDAQAARDAFDIFKEITLRFPHSRYAKEARERMHELVEAQAKYEINTARYYFVRQAYLAAINRAQIVLTDFQTSPQAEAALEIMADSYAALNMKEKEADIRRIIEANKNRPSFDSYERAQEFERLKQQGLLK